MGQTPDALADTLGTLGTINLAGDSIFQPEPSELNRTSVTQNTKNVKGSTNKSMDFSAR